MPIVLSLKNPDFLFIIIKFFEKKKHFFVWINWWLDNKQWNKNKTCLNWLCWILYGNRKIKIYEQGKCVTSPLLFLTVRSYCIHKSSNDFTNLLCMYPVSAVFTAVSTSPSLKKGILIELTFLKYLWRWCVDNILSYSWLLK